MLRLLVERARALTHEPGLGYYFGLQLKLSSHGSVGFAAMTSATLRAALHIAERYVALRMPFLTLRLEIEGDTAALVMGDSFAERDARVFAIEALFTALVQMARSVLGRNLQGLFELASTSPHTSPASPTVAGARALRAAAQRAAVPARCSTSRLQMADEVAARQALAECERELSTLTRPALCSRACASSSARASGAFPR